MAHDTSSSMVAEYERAIRLSSVAITDSLITDDPSPSSSAADSDNDKNARSRNADRLVARDEMTTPDDGGEDGTSISFHSELLALKMTVDEEKQELMASSESERIQAVSDLYGTTSYPTELEKLVAAMEQELSNIPTERKRAVLLARASSPLLFSAPSHAKVFLRAEDNDPKRAAERMVRYWDKRVAFFGDAAFSQEMVQTSSLSTSKIDYLRHYTRSQEVLADVSANEEMRQIANDYVKEYEQFKITDLDLELEAMPCHERMALNQARLARPELADHPGHKILFLRSCDFDVPNAVRRMVNYWHTALELFGADVAFYEAVTVASLLEEHSDEMTLGLVSLCPGTDAGGRVVLCVRAPSRHDISGCTHEGLIKAVWYILHAALQRNSARGYVVVFVFKDPPSTLAEFSLRKKLAKLWLETIPIHVRFVHVCVLASAESWFFFNLVYPVIRRLAGRELRRRFWLHRGTNEEIATELRNCGLSDEQIPSEVGGDASLEFYGDWLEDRFENGL